MSSLTLTSLKNDFFNFKNLSIVEKLVLKMQEIFIEDFSAKNSYVLSAPNESNEAFNSCYLEHSFVLITNLDERLQNYFKLKVSIQNTELNTPLYSFSIRVHTVIKYKDTLNGYCTLNTILTNSAHINVEALGLTLYRLLEPTSTVLHPKLQSHIHRLIQELSP